MLYSGWITAVCGLLQYDANLTDPSSATPTDNAAFNKMIASAIDYTENRLQRDLDLLGTVVSVTGAMVPNLRKQTIPISGGVFVVCSEIRPVIGGVQQPPLEFVSRETLDNFWPSDASPGANIVPTQWTTNDQISVLVGPAPDQAYGFEAVGTIRVPQLSATTISNILTLWFPDLYLQASMVFWFQYQRDFGAQAEDPKTAQSAENQYQLLLKSAGVEEVRKRLANMVSSPSNPVSLEAG